MAVTCEKCEVNAKRWSGEKTGIYPHYSVELCPIHAAAEEMLEALRRIATLGLKPSANVAIAQCALAKAQHSVSEPETEKQT